MIAVIDYGVGNIFSLYSSFRAIGELFNYKTKYYYLFSKSGFTKGCEDKAKEMGNVNLVEYYKIMEEM